MHHEEEAAECRGAGLSVGHRGRRRAQAAGGLLRQIRSVSEPRQQEERVGSADDGGRRDQKALRPREASLLRG